MKTPRGNPGRAMGSKTNRSPTGTLYAMERNGHPENAEAERQVLAAVLVDPSRADEALALLRPRDFLDPAHRLLFEHFELLHRDGKPIDPALLRESMQNATSGDVSAWQEAGGAGYVGRLVQQCASAANLAHYIAIVREHSLRRRGRDVLAMASDRLDVRVNGETAADVLTSLARDCEQIAQESAVFDFEALTAGDLADFEEETTYIIEGAMVQGEPGVMAAGKKTLKTSIALDAGISLVTGKPFLDAFKVRQQRVGFMSGETGKRTFRGLLRRICRAKGVDPHDVEGFVFSSTLPQFGSDRHMAALKRWIRRHSVEVLFIDPVYLCGISTDHAKSIFAMGELLAEIASLCQSLDVTLVLIHHTTKSGGANPYAPVELEQIAFAGWQEFARQWLLIGRRAWYEPGSGLHQLWLTTGGSAGHGGLYAVDVDEGQFDGTDGRKWRVTVTSATDAVEAARRDKDKKQAEKAARAEVEHRRRLMEALKLHPQGETKTALKTESGLNSANFATAIRTLLKERRAETCRIVKNGREEDAYKPAEPNGRTRTDTDGQANGCPGVEGEERSVGQDSLPIGESPSVRPSDLDSDADSSGNRQAETCPGAHNEGAA